MMMSEAMIIQAYQEASLTSLMAFNQQDATRCAEQYSENSIMHARPFGVIVPLPCKGIDMLFVK